MYGIVVAMIVRNWTFASNGNEAIYTTASATYRASKTGSAAIEPDGCDRERAPSDPWKDIVDAVAYLAGPGSDWANGQIIRISGGAVSSSLLQRSEYC